MLAGDVSPAAVTKRTEERALELTVGHVDVAKLVLLVGGIGCSR